MIENADHAIGVSLRSDGYSKVVGIQEIKLPTEEELAAEGRRKASSDCLNFSRNVTYVRK